MRDSLRRAWGKYRRDALNIFNRSRSRCATITLPYPRYAGLRGTGDMERQDLGTTTDVQHSRTQRHPQKPACSADLPPTWRGAVGHTRVIPLRRIQISPAHLIWQWGRWMLWRTPEIVRRIFIAADLVRVRQVGADGQAGTLGCVNRVRRTSGVQSERHLGAALAQHRPEFANV